MALSCLDAFEISIFVTPAAGLGGAGVVTLFEMWPASSGARLLPSGLLQPSQFERLCRYDRPLGRDHISD